MLETEHRLIDAHLEAAEVVLRRPGDVLEGIIGGVGNAQLAQHFHGHRGADTRLWIAVLDLDGDAERRGHSGAGGQRHGVKAGGAGLGEQPLGQGLHQQRIQAAAAGNQMRVLHAGNQQGAQLPFDAPALHRGRGAGLGNEREQVCQGGYRQPVGGQRAAVHGAGQPGGGLTQQAAENVADARLQRMIGLEIALQRPSVVTANGQHVGVLAAAVAVQGTGLLVGAQQPFPIRAQGRCFDTALECALGQAEPGEQGGHPLGVYWLAIVR